MSKTLTESVDAVVARDYQMLIGGKLTQAADGASYDVQDPSTGERVASAPRAGVADVRAAVESASRAQREWESLGIRGRGAFFKDVAAAIDDNLENIALLDAVNAGNPIAAMQADVRYALSQLNDWPALALSVTGMTIPASPGGLHYTTLRPYGVVGRIIPYNHPALFTVSGFAPALAAGNTVVLKTSEQAPLSALFIGSLVKECLPPGVLNIISGGRETGDAIVTHPDIRRIGFTGSQDVGRMIQRRAAEVGVKNVSLELGGKNPLIVFPDADVDAVVAGAVRGMNFQVCQGQSCGSNSRILVHSAVHGEVLQGLKEGLEQLSVGPSYDETVDMGPVISGSHHRRVMDYIQSGARDGAKLVTGGGRPQGLERGFFIEPTLFDGVSTSMAIGAEEIFGPVMSVGSWDNYEEMIREANNVDYGLTASIWTQDLDLAYQTAVRMEAGYVWINDANRHFWGVPFGGHKNSGLGREESIHELESYMQIQAVNTTFQDAESRLGKWVK